MISALPLLLAFTTDKILPLDALTLPHGYKIEVVAQAPNVRQLALAEDGTLFGGSRQEGNVYGFIDHNKDGIYENTIIIANNLNMPSGIAVKGNDLYVAEVSRILKYKKILPLKGPASPNSYKAETYYSGLPKKRHHGWKYLKFGPKENMYFNIGAPCNTCMPALPFASIAKLDADKKLTLVAEGVRNSVGFAWHPKTHQLWFTENGRDYLGDDKPSDELNRISSPKQHFGFPFIHAHGIPDPQYSDPTRKPDQFTEPTYALGAHVAPLGMTFINQTIEGTPNFNPEADEQTLLIAEHGSWNRSKKVGYRVVKLKIKDNKVIQHENFITGWLQGEKHWGRPNDIIQDTDGSLLISDDYAGVIYRVSKQ